MCNKPFQVKFTLLIFICILSSGYESFAKESKTIERTLVDTANDFNKQLPMTLDNETRLDTIIAYKKTLRYKFTLNTNKDQFDYSGVKKIKEPELINNICTNKNMSILLNKGVNYIYIYYDKSGVELIRFDIDRSKCSK